MVHIGQVLPVGEVDGLAFPVQPILGQAGLFEIQRVPGVQDQGVHDGAGHQLDHAGALLPGAGRLLVGLRGWRAVIVLHGRHGQGVGLLVVVLLVEPRALGPLGWGETADHVVQGGAQGPLLGVGRGPVIGDGRP